MVTRAKEGVRDEIQKGRRDSREERQMILTSIRQITLNIQTRQENVYIFYIKVLSEICPP